MNQEQRKIARHMLGLDNPDAKGRSYRNRYFAGRGHAAWDELHAMCGAGWVNMADEPNGKQTRFWLTPMGAFLALDVGEELDPEDFPTVTTKARTRPSPDAFKAGEHK